MKIIHLTFDLDNDFFEKSFSQKSTLNNKWDGFRIGVPKIFEIINKFEKKYNTKIKSTWFVRIDKDIENEFGDACYFLKKFIEIHETDNVEIGWHPHIYKKNSKTKFENNDKFIIDEMDYIYNKIVGIRSNIKSFRMGGMYMSNKILNFLQEKSFKIDSSSFPGRCREDDIFSFDWINSIDKPYYPSKKNIKISSQNINDNFRLLEIPLSTIKVKANYDKIYFDRYLDLSFHNKLISKKIEKYISENDYITIIYHPCCILDGIYAKHELINFGSSNFKNNLKIIFNTLIKNRLNFNFQNLSELSI